jgi:hypothetical protein
LRSAGDSLCNAIVFVSSTKLWQPNETDSVALGARLAEITKKPTLQIAINEIK